MQDSAAARRSLKFLFAMEIFSGLSRGSYLVCIGWITLISSDDIAKVGQVFIVAMLTTILAGPVLGVVVDRQNLKHLVIVANLGIALAMSALAALWFTTPDPNLIWLFAAVVVISALRVLHHTAHDGLIRANSDTPDIVRTLARFRTTHLLLTAAGTVATGSIIEHIAPAAGFLFSALASFFLVLPMIFVTGVLRTEKTHGIAGFLSDLKGGLDVFRSNRDVRFVAMLAGISLPVGQLANAILSAFIRDDLGRGSEAFGIVDAAWPIGGMLAAVTLSLGLRQFSAKGMEYVFAAAAGVFTIGLSISTSLPVLVVLHGAMGFSVWLCRIVIDSRVIEASTVENLGRTKVYVEMVFSASAVIMCLSPTIAALPSAGSYFSFWGAVMVAGAGILWLLRRPLEPQN